MAGKIDKIKGRIKKAAGELTDDNKLKLEGTIDKLSGNVKSGVSKVKKVLKGKSAR